MLNCEGKYHKHWHDTPLLRSSWTVPSCYYSSIKSLVSIHSYVVWTIHTLFLLYTGISLDPFHLHHHLLHLYHHIRSQTLGSDQRSSRPLQARPEGNDILEELLRVPTDVQNCVRFLHDLREDTDLLHQYCNVFVLPGKKGHESLDIVSHFCWKVLTGHSWWLGLSAERLGWHEFVGMICYLCWSFSRWSMWVGVLSMRLILTEVQYVLWEPETSNGCNRLVWLSKFRLMRQDNQLKNISTLPPNDYLGAYRSSETTFLMTQIIFSDL